jgi:hypothetical protein
MTLDYGLRLREALQIQASEDSLNLKVFMTRDADVHVSGSARARVARDNGADVIFIIHFNSQDSGPHPHTARGTLEVRRTIGNVNSTEDTKFIDTVIDKIVPVIPGGGKLDFFVFNTSVASDVNLGNTDAYKPIRAGYCEVEFIDNPAVDSVLNTGPNAAQVKQAIVNAMRDGIIEDIRTQPTE